MTEPSSSTLVRGLVGLALLYAVVLMGCGPQDDDQDDNTVEEPPQVQLICDRSYLPALTNLVESAQEQITIAHWELFSGEATASVLNLLSEAVTRGVEVQVLLDDEIDENADGVEWMQGRGIDARIDFDQDTRLHGKMLIADRDLVLLGSTNWSNSSIRHNRECNLLAYRSQSATYLRSWFEGLLSDPGDREPPDLGQDSPEEFSALVDDQILEHLLQRLDAAQFQIDFTLYATYLQPTNLQAPAMKLFSALTEAAERGVAVRGVADWSDWNHDNNDSNRAAVQWLRARGVEMRWDEPDVTTHAKVFRIDDAVQVQSANVSSGGFRWNREVAGWTGDSSVVDDVAAWFEPLWDASMAEPETG